MDQDDEEEEINVHDDDSPLDMRITKHDSDSESVRPSVIRRAPSFKETSNSPSRGKNFFESSETRLILDIFFQIQLQHVIHLLMNISVAHLVLIMISLFATSWSKSSWPYKSRG